MIELICKESRSWIKYTWNRWINDFIFAPRIFVPTFFDKPSEEYDVKVKITQEGKKITIEEVGEK